MKDILIAGGTGLIGRHLCRFLRKQGYAIRLLSRHPERVREYPAFKWDIPTRYLDPASLDGVDAIVNLAGASIVERPWTKKRKALLVASRVDATHLLREALDALKVKPRRYIAASAIGYYGDRADEWVDEHSEGGQRGFLTTLARQWEAAAEAIAQSGVATALLRIGIVLARDGGALKPMALPGKLGLAPYFGHGRQWYSWIHVADLVRMIHQLLLQPELEGPWNGVSPHPVPLKTFVQTIAQVQRGFAWIFPVPESALRLVMGELADAMCSSTRVHPRRWQEETGFRWLYPQLQPALEELLRRPAASSDH